jgi:hypothetical protein
MKTRIITIGFMVLVACVCSSAGGADRTFDSNGQILPGETWDTVYVRNNGTVVDMSGGQIGSLDSFGGLKTYDSSIFNMSGGQIIGYSSGFNSISINDSSTFNVSGGTIDMYMDFVVYGSANANISGGNVTAGRLKTSPDSVVNITGGILNFDLYGFDIRGELNIYRGLLNVENAGIYPEATINIFGYGFDYAIGQEGILTGYLSDNNFFTIKGISPSEYTRFNLIPEPMSLFFLGFGLLIIRHHKK